MPEHVVVDGSNIATEGRSQPSLLQLREAVAAFAAEHPSAKLSIVVDATFGHRIDPSEVADWDPDREPDRFITASALPNDPSFSRLYGLNNSGQTGGLADADIDVKVKRVVGARVDLRDIGFDGRIRDGRSFTTRRVVAIAHGEVIFNLQASFQVIEDGLDHL